MVNQIKTQIVEESVRKTDTLSHLNSMNFNAGTKEDKETLEVKEEMTIDEEGKVLDRKIIDSNENIERFPFLEMHVISQFNNFILLQLCLKKICFLF